MENDLKLLEKRVDQLCTKHSTHTFDENFEFTNKNVFITGATGFVGCNLLRHLVKRNCHVYCVVRDGKDGTSAQERLDNISKLSKINSENVHLIKGNYRKNRLGISDNDWDFLSKKIDIIFHLGCRTNFTMTYEKAKFSIFNPTLDMIELSITNKTKALIYSGSCIAYISGKYQGMYGLHKGYCCSKYIIHKLLNYYHNKTGNPIKIMYIGYLQSLHDITDFDYTDSLESLMYMVLKSGLFPDFDFEFDYADLDEVLTKVLRHNFKDLPFEFGVHCTKPYKWKDLYKSMKKLVPNLKKVDNIIFRRKQNNIYKKYPYLTYLGSDKIDGVITNDFNDQMNGMFGIENIPKNNLDIVTPDEEFFDKLMETLTKEFIYE